MVTEELMKKWSGRAYRLSFLDNRYYEQLIEQGNGNKEDE